MTIKQSIMGFAAVWLMLAPANGEQGVQKAQDAYIAGYARALLDGQFSGEAATVEVNNGRVIIGVSDLQGADRKSIERSLLEIEGVHNVEIVKCDPPPPGQTSVETTQPGSYETHGERLGLEEDVEPQLPRLFPKGDLFGDLLADPRGPRFSLGLLDYRGHERLDTVAATSFGETLGLIRGRTLLGGQWQVGIQASVFAIFDMDSDSNDLLNNDYRVGFPLSYRRGELSAQLHLYHQSSHLGDEYILRNRITSTSLNGNSDPTPEDDKLIVADGTDNSTNSRRINLSYEAVDLRLSWNASPWLRTYGGPGYIFNHTDDTELESWAMVSGVELQSPWSLFGGTIRPLTAVHVEGWQYRNWEPDVSVRAGFSIENMRVEGDRAVIAFAYYKGRDINGQFLLNAEIEYLGLVMDVYF